MFGLLRQLLALCSGEGLQLDNIGKPVKGTGQLTISTIMVSLGVSCGVLAVLVWYVDNIMPGPFGVGQPLHFPLLVTPSFSLFSTFRIFNSFE